MKLPEWILNRHRGWASLDEFIEVAAMTTRPDADIGQGAYCLFVNGTWITARGADLNLADRNRLNGYGAVIYHGAEQKPLYFEDEDEGIERWNSICLELHHPEACYDLDAEDGLPPRKLVSLDRLN